MAIKHICFDIGGVANKQLDLGSLRFYMEKYWDGKFSWETLKQTWYPYHDGRDIWREFQNGQIDGKTYLSIVLKTANLDDSAENRSKLESTLKAWCGTPFRPMLDLVDRLNKAGYHTSVLSNNNEIMYYNLSSEIKNRVHLGLSSHLIGVSKPDERAYRKWLWVTGAKAGETIFVDDKQRNIEAAGKLGIHGYRFRSEEIGMYRAFWEFVDFLKEKGLRF